MRAFVALELPAEVRAGVARAQTRLREAAPSADVRWTDPDGSHVTAKFLGAVEDARVAALRDALAAVAAGVRPFACATAGLGAFPSPRRARVVWLGVAGADDGPSSVAAALDTALAPLGFVPEARPFHPHVTLGRVRSPRALGVLARALEEIDPGPPAGWVAREIVLFQSHTRPTGAVYEALARIPFGGRT